MMTRAFNLLMIIMLASAMHTSLHAQGASLIDVELPDPDKYELEKVMGSSGEGDSKFVYSPSKNPDPKDSLTGNSTQTPNAAAAVTKVRSEKTPPPTKETVVKQSKNLEETSKTKNDDSIMSFHFLYYIIEKYKLQDIVD